MYSGDLYDIGVHLHRPVPPPPPPPRAWTQLDQLSFEDSLTIFREFTLLPAMSSDNDNDIFSFDELFCENALPAVSSGDLIDIPRPIPPPPPPPPLPLPPLAWTPHDEQQFQDTLTMIAMDVGSESPEEVFDHYQVLPHNVQMIDPIVYVDDNGPMNGSITSGSGPVSGYVQPPCQSEPREKEKQPKHWTIDEHKSFLRGVDDCGWGDWKQISRFWVKSKTPCQVASHAQKYNLRKEKRSMGIVSKRKSIHDITTP